LHAKRSFCALWTSTGNWSKTPGGQRRLAQVVGAVDARCIAPLPSCYEARCGYGHMLGTSSPPSQRGVGGKVDTPRKLRMIFRLRKSTTGWTRTNCESALLDEVRRCTMPGVDVAAWRGCLNIAASWLVVGAAGGGQDPDRDTEWWGSRWGVKRRDVAEEGSHLACGAGADVVGGRQRRRERAASTTWRTWREVARWRKKWIGRQGSPRRDVLSDPRRGPRTAEGSWPTWTTSRDSRG